MGSLALLHPVPWMIQEFFSSCEDQESLLLAFSLKVLNSLKEKLLIMDSKYSEMGPRLGFSIDLISHLLLTNAYFSEKAAGCLHEVSLVSEASQL